MNGGFATVRGVADECLTVEMPLQSINVWYHGNPGFGRLSRVGKSHLPADKLFVLIAEQLDNGCVELYGAFLYAVLDLGILQRHPPVLGIKLFADIREENGKGWLAGLLLLGRHVPPQQLNHLAGVSSAPKLAVREDTGNAVGPDISDNPILASHKGTLAQRLT
ncbi:hypothetical protein MKX08_001341 [Trichoderma sp. CBMAI-0020]|nr:hypothetical protein MKX08_001341 [Trichoderma sp. CBMAI-0020]